ncbi:MAG TPA: MFS transporter, partial [Caldilineaceae bacterium]|nr:MFS transporter [Caldilineaceae bacterium]
MLRRIFYPFGWGAPTKLALILFLSALYVYLPVFTLYLQGNGLSLLQVNSLWGVLVAALFLAEVPTGLLADRIGRARSVQMALLFQLIGELLFFFGNSYPAYLLAAVAGGIGFAFSSGAAEALIYDWLLVRGRENEMSRAMGYINAAHKTAQLIAFGAGGWLALGLTPERFRLGIAFTAGMVGVAWLLTFGLADERAADDGEAEPSSWQLLGDGLTLLRTNRTLLVLALLAVFTLPLGDYLLNLYQPHFVILGVPPLWLGLGMAGGSLVGAVATANAWRLQEWLGERAALLLAAGLPGLFYLLFAAAGTPAPSVLLFILLVGSIGLKRPIFSEHLNRHISNRNRATLLSLISMATSFYDAAIGLVIGGVADGLGLIPAFVLMGGMILM